jgi:hypothetical protein
MTIFQTAAHIFSVSERTHKTFRENFTESGIWELPQEEICKLSAVMSERDVRWAVDQLMASSERYNEAQEYESARAMAARAAMWAISKPLGDEK